MLQIDPETTLAQVVTEHPRTAAVLERLELDYCCGGNQRLRDAVDAAGLVVDEVVAELGAVDDGRDDAGEWASLGLAELVDHIEATHHQWLRAALERLERLAAKVERVHGARRPELVEVHQLVRALRSDLEPHMQKEERVLFPMIRMLEGAEAAPRFHCGSLRNPIGMMRFEHEQTSEILDRMRAATSGYVVPAGACGSYRSLYEGLADVEADTHLHVFKENHVLFPAALTAEGLLAGEGPSS